MKKLKWTRNEKILGDEYSTIYYNECSQIGEEEAENFLTQLTQKSRLINDSYFQSNPLDKKDSAYMIVY